MRIDDIEALVAADGGYWVIGSQSRTKNGELRPERQRILAPDGRLLTPDFSACAECVAASDRAPNNGGLNVEAAAWVGGQLWLGLRAPLTAEGKALLLRLSPDGKVEEEVPVDLGGDGFRDLTPGRSGLLVVSGPVADGGGMGLWQLADPHAAPQRLGVPLNGTVEGLALAPDGRLVYVTDGDGKPGKCAEPATWGSLPFG